MECTKCKKKLDLIFFSYKNVKDKIFYLHCDNCRNKITQQKNKKNIEYINYENLKDNNKILCLCGKKYIAFREYHILRHLNSKNHINYININK